MKLVSRGSSRAVAMAAVTLCLFWVGCGAEEALSDLFAEAEEAASQTEQALRDANRQARDQYNEHVDYVQRMNGVGSEVQLVLNPEGRFGISVDGEKVEGTYERLETGFLELTTDDGQRTHGIFVPGFAAILKDLGSDRLIPLVFSGACPTGAGAGNWLVVRSDDPLDANNGEDWTFGSLAVDFSTGEATVTGAYNLADPLTNILPGPVSLGTARCEGGVTSISGGDIDAQLYLSTLGGAAIDVQEAGSDYALLALPQEPGTGAPGTYAGVVYDSTNDDAFPVVMTVDAEGQAEAYELTDVRDASSTTGDPLYISFEDVGEPEPGMVIGTYAGGGKMACMVVNDAASSGRTIGFCIGQHPDDPSASATVVFVQRQPEPAPSDDADPPSQPAPGEACYYGTCSGDAECEADYLCAPNGCCEYDVGG